MIFSPSSLLQCYVGSEFDLSKYLALRRAEDDEIQASLKRASEEEVNAISFRVYSSLSEVLFTGGGAGTKDKENKKSN